jgi:hypothetical protein
MAPLDIIFITHIAHRWDSTNPGNLVFEVTPDLFRYPKPKNYIVDTNHGLMIDAGTMQLAGVDTRWVPVAGHIGRANLYAVKGEIKDVLEQIANDTYYGTIENARSQRERDVRIIRQFVAKRILSMATS